MNITIEITSKRAHIKNKIKFYKGKIHIGDYWESIYIPLDWWSIRDYKQQWKEALEQIKIHNSSCLIVTIHNPNVSGYIEMWALYRRKNVIYIQNNVYHSEWYKRFVKNKILTLDNWHEFIPRRTINTPEKRKCSEWSVPFEPDKG